MNSNLYCRLHPS